MMVTALPNKSTKSPLTFLTCLIDVIGHLPNARGYHGVL